ncbi:MAG: hypothetical protein U0411_12030, partial [Thermodesulfovibrionales bacterium]
MKKRSGDESAETILAWSRDSQIETCFDRAEKMKPCPIGESGACCSVCHMGPCRLVGKGGEEGPVGICGADVDTVAARKLVRMIGAGSACHGDHGRDMAFTLRAVANGETQDIGIRDARKLYRVAGILGVEFEGRAVHEVARDVAQCLLDDFSKQWGGVSFTKRAPGKTRERWIKWGILPRGIDREIVEAFDRTTMGMDSDPDSLLLLGLRVALANGWGGSMISTEVSDILFGTPTPVRAEANLGVFRDDRVNIVVHGHEPTLAEMLIEVVEEPEIVAYAQARGAKGISLCGMCCTANEVMMRHGIPAAGGFTNQELSLMTGLVEAMVVDVQCIMPALAKAAEKFHTALITTSEKVKIRGARHLPFDEHRAKEVAREIVKIACDAFPERKKEGSHVTASHPVIAGFSHEYIEYMQGGRWR